jgi:hypothetical protein
MVNLEARYPVKASLYELAKTGVPETDAQYKKRVNVDCRLWITDKLMSPNIRYDIYLPSSDQETRNKVENIINNDEEKNKQFLSLLVLNSFMQPESSNQLQDTKFSNIGAAGAGVTGIEFLSNQFSHWLSQISKDVDIGVNYHAGDQITNQEVEVALSTQLLNDRVTINGNVDVGVENTNGKVANSQTNNIVGDFNLEYKLKENGKLRLKVFNRSNDSYFDKINSPYTQGVGIFYKEDFNSLDELLKNYYKVIFTKKEKVKNDEVETDNNTILYPKSEPIDSTIEARNK